MLMNHVVAAAAGLVLDQPSFFSTRLKKLILPPSVSIFMSMSTFMPNIVTKFTKYKIRTFFH